MQIPWIGDNARKERYIHCGENGHVQRKVLSTFCFKCHTSCRILAGAPLPGAHRPASYSHTNLRHAAAIPPCPDRARWGLRIQCRKAWEFKSPLSHHRYNGRGRRSPRARAIRSELRFEAAGSRPWPFAKRQKQTNRRTSNHFDHPPLRARLRKAYAINSPNFIALSSPFDFESVNTRFPNANGLPLPPA